MNKSMLWTIASILTLSGLAVFVYLLWNKIPITGGSFALGDLTNMATLVIAIFSLYVAVAAYQKSVKDSEEQQKSLDDSRKQLQAVVDAASKQQEILTKNLETSKAQLNLLEEQWKRELERQGRKPNVELSFATNKGTIKLDDLAKTEFGFSFSDKDKKWGRVHLLVINTGKESVIRPVVRMEASPNTVFIDRPDQRIMERNDHSVLQYSGMEILDIEPVDISGGPSSFSGDVTVPDGIESFDIKFVISAKNLKRKEQVLHFKINR